MKYAVVTFGCRVNQADSLEIEGELRARGAVGVAPGDADVVIVNTCSVTAAADQGARQAIRRVARVNPSAQIVVTGCYATRQPGDVASLPNVVRVIPNPHKDGWRPSSPMRSASRPRPGLVAVADPAARRWSPAWRGAPR